MFPSYLNARTGPLAFLLLLVLFLVDLPQPAQAQNARVVDEIAAVVDDEIILRSEVDQLVLGIQQQQNQPYSRELWMDALDELINQQVLAAEARRDTNIQVSEQQVESTLDQRLNQMIQQVGGEEELEEIYGRSLLQLRTDLREQFRNQMLAERLRNERMRGVDITPSEVRTWFEEIPEDSLPELPTTVRLAHIVRYPEPDPEAREEAREIIETIRDSIVIGQADIEDMARRFSDDPGSAPQGGRIQGANLDDLYPEFAAVASRIPLGEISQPFETPLGFHIVRVNERSGATVDFNHVLIRIDERSADPEPTLEYLSTVRDSLIEFDMPFALAARRHSEEARSANNSGRVTDPRSGVRDLVYDALGPSWTSTIDTMEVGEISEPTSVQLLDGRQGYHIVKLQRRRPAHRLSLETDYEQIRQYALQDKRARKMQEWVAQLREETYVDIRVTQDDLAARRP